MSVASVIVNDFNVALFALRPSETDPVLVIDADAVLTESITLEHLQSIPRRRPEDVERRRRMQLGELAPDNRLDPNEATYSVPREECLRFSVRERNNHRSIAYRLSISDHRRDCQVLQSACAAKG
jgi:hypothetical protein